MFILALIFEEIIAGIKIKRDNITNENPLITETLPQFCILNSIRPKEKSSIPIRKKSVRLCTFDKPLPSTGLMSSLFPVAGFLNSMREIKAVLINNPSIGWAGLVQVSFW